jgi:hypothetical protein
MSHAIAPGQTTSVGGPPISILKPWVLACCACKLKLERSARRSLGLPAPWLRGALALVCKDGLLLVTWVGGLLRNVVVWRGNRLAVLAGAVLVPIDQLQPLDPRADGRDAVVVGELGG